MFIQLFFNFMNIKQRIKLGYNFFYIIPIKLSNMALLENKKEQTSQCSNTILVVTSSQFKDLSLRLPCTLFCRYKYQSIYLRFIHLIIYLLTIMIIVLYVDYRSLADDLGPQTISIYYHQGWGAGKFFSGSGSWLLFFNGSGS